MMDKHPFFQLSATPQLIILPYENRVLMANDEACLLLGLSLSEIRQTAVTYFFSADVPELIAFTEKVLAQHKGYAEFMLKLKNEDIQVGIHARSVVMGDIAHLLLSLNKIAEQKQRDDFKEIQNYYHSGIGYWNYISHIFQDFERENKLLLDAAGDGIYGVDKSGSTTFLNPAAERILGYKASELAGKNMHKMVHHSNADGTHFRDEDCPIFEAFRDGTVHKIEDDVFWTKSGKPIDVEYTSTPIKDKGTVIGAVVIFRDVTQKKSDHKKLLEALNEVETLKNKLEQEKAYLQEEIKSDFNHHNIIGKSAAIQHVIRQVSLVAPTDSTVLITGESGTGKELIARAIHEMSLRSKHPLIRVNCSAIPADLFESEFFGHVKGAFTGASSDRLGRFELADGGTLFLDEVGEIPLNLQGKLLRVLQEQQFDRVGESKTRHTDVRIISATNRDLKQLVNQGLFREDLYFRLNVFPIESIPLRKRKEDIPILTQFFLQKFSLRTKKHELKIPISELKNLQAYHWPGNIRELENVIERQVILTQGDTLRFSHLIASPESHFVEAKNAEPHAILTKAQLVKKEYENIISALKACNGKVSGADGAAELLAIKTTTLYSRIKKYGIDCRQFKTANDA
ncbi:MAG: sigma 54-interacting transcriptional regulator [Pseudomonadota bacterium]|uniref:sigma 54-interacting transcriptional regulator n=1 Tax=Methylophaga aminisulfidivorans TaxID=230105 RepID=UPI0024E1CFAE|nr:sigma 54-interacting transcriptional regulator [Methylophaga aminisulfidivorans]MEC9413068.1 sigma 54-interacting transcriptional regulator [Pseudomonadota bacterium]